MPGSTAQSATGSGATMRYAAGNSLRDFPAPGEPDAAIIEGARPLTRTHSQSHSDGRSPCSRRRASTCVLSRRRCDPRRAARGVPRRDGHGHVRTSPRPEAPGRRDGHRRAHCLPEHHAVLRAAGVLSCVRDDRADGRFGYQGGSLAAPPRLEPKFQAVGNGDAAGVISYDAMVEAIRRGYATSSTDTGHVGNTMAFALGHRDKYVDFGYRAVHEMTVTAKAIVEAFYGTAPVHSYWNGCSQGGRQGITEAIRYPADFDAIIAGAPAIAHMQLHARAAGIEQVRPPLRRQLYSAREISGDSPCGAERVRRARRRRRRPDREAVHVSLRSGDPRMPEWRRSLVPDGRSGRNGARDVRAHCRPRYGTGRFARAPAAGLRVGVGPPCRHRAADQRGRAVQVRGVQERAMGLAGVSSVYRSAAGVAGRRRHHQSGGSEPAAVFRCRRQAADVSRLVRSAGAAAGAPSPISTRS